MSIVFFGASDLGHACCNALMEAGVPIKAIVTAPERFRISYAPTGIRNVLHRSFDDIAEAHEVPLFALKDGMRDPDLLTFLRAYPAQLGVIIGWYHMVPDAIRSLFPRGAVGLHASLLPKYRGGAPLVWALINQEATAGVTLFRLNDGVDDGDVYAQEAFPLEGTDDIATALAKAKAASVNVVCATVPRILDGGIDPVPQDHSTATIYPQRSPADGLIDWSKSTAEVLAFIRAQTRPYPGAFTQFEGTEIRLWSARPVDAQGPPGIILAHTPEGTVIATADGAVCVTEADPPFIAPVGVAL